MPPSYRMVCVSQSNIFLVSWGDSHSLPIFNGQVYQPLFLKVKADAVPLGHEKATPLIFVLKEISFQMEGFFDLFPPYGLH